MIKPAKINYCLKIFTNSSIYLWNQLTDKDIDAPNLNELKKQFEAFFYNLDFKVITFSLPIPSF